jgi:hypothetical protein
VDRRGRLPRSGRHQHGVATLDDLLLLALIEAEGAWRVLPPNAVGPLANNGGEIHTPDPAHASACADRAMAFLTLARRKLP